MTTIYVGNLPFNATEQDVKALFERHGKVESVKLINDRETGKPRGLPVSRSLINLTDSTLPWRSNNALMSCSVALKGRLPT